MTFIEKTLLINVHGNLREVKVSLCKPRRIDEKYMFCDVKFCGIEKYNAKIKGIDEFNTIECALDYVKTIFINSKDPEFFSEIGESMLGYGQ